MEERLQKVLAQAGVASRREAEKYITEGRVKVNGKVVKELGAKVGAKAFIMVDGHPIRREQKLYLLFYKPRGVVTTLKDPEGRRCIADYVKDIPRRVFPVGRLDYNTEGLLLLTNDGELTQALTHPSHEVNKTYEVTVPGIVPQEKLDLLRIGVKLEDGMTAPAWVELLNYDYDRNLTKFTMTIHEGRNRQVRRMCDFIGFPVRTLKRVKMGTLTLNGLRRGDCRELFDEEVENLRRECGLATEAVPGGVEERLPQWAPAYEKGLSVRKKADKRKGAEGSTGHKIGKPQYRIDRGNVSKAAGRIDGTGKGTTPRGGAEGSNGKPGKTHRPSSGRKSLETGGEGQRRNAVSAVKRSGPREYGEKLRRRGIKG